MVAASAKIFAMFSMNNEPGVKGTEKIRRVAFRNLMPVVFKALRRHVAAGKGDVERQELMQDALLEPVVGHPSPEVGIMSDRAA
jgi:hypothetical protein